jgi:PhnB protein
MKSFNPYLRFDGNCREAMTFYKEALGGELHMQTVGESPMAAQISPEAHQKIMHSRLNGGGFVLMGSDMVGPEGLVTGNAITLLVDCSTEDEIESLFSKLSAGGKVTYPLKQEFWGGIFGTFIDKFGMEWQLNYDKS